MKFQDKFKKASDLNEIDWDKGAMWESIEKDLPPKKKKRRFIFLFWGLSVLVVSSFILIWSFASSEPHEDNSIVDQVIVSNPAIETVTPIATTGLDIKQNEVSSIDRSNENLSNRNSRVIKEVVKKSNNTIYTGNQFFPNSKIDQNLPGEYKSETGLNFIPRSNDLKDSQNIGQEIKYTTRIDDKYPSTNKNYLSQSIIEIAGIRAIHISPFATNTKYELIKHDYKISPIIKPISTSNYTLGLKTYVGFTNQNVVSLNSANDEFVDLHNASKKVQESLGAEINVRRSLMDHFSIGLGLNYFSSFEWYNGRETSITKETIMSDSASYYTINGLKNFVDGEVIQSTSITSNYKSPVRRQFIDIPLEFVVDFEVFNLTIEAFAKYNFNISHRLSGRTYSNQLNLLDSSSSEIQNMYRSTGVNSYSYGLDALYSIHRNYAGIFGLYYRKQLNSSFSSLIEVDETYSSYGISLGLIYKL